MKFACRNIEGLGTVPDIRFFFRLFVAFSLTGDDMHQGRTFKVFDTGKHFDQRFNIMTIYRPDITKTQVFEQTSGNEHSLYSLVYLMRIARDFFTDTGNCQQKLTHLLFDFQHHLPGHDLTEMRGHASDIGGYSHFVVVEHNDHIILNMSGMVESFKSHSCSQRTIPNDRNYIIFFFFQVPCLGKSQRGGNRSAAVSAVPVVVLALFPLGETT